MRSFLEGKQEAGEEVIEDEDEDDGVDHGLCDGTSDAARSADGHQSLVTADGADDDREDGALEQAVEHVAEFDHKAEVHEEGLEGDADLFVKHGDEPAAEPADENREEDENRKRDGDGDDAREHEVMARLSRSLNQYLVGPVGM